MSRRPPVRRGNDEDVAAGCCGLLGVLYVALFVSAFIAVVIILWRAAL